MFWGTGALLLAAATDTAVDVENALKRFVDVFSVVQREAADPVPSESAVYQGAIPGMLRKLDPHSVFFDPGQYEQLKQMERSEQKGFGTILSLAPGRVIVLQAMAGTPSAKAGLAPGDEILAVNNIALGRLDMDQMVGYLGEARQHQAALDVRRPGNARMMRFVLDPALIDSPSVDRAFLLTPGFGYIRVASFDPQTGKQFKEAVEKLGGDKLQGLVIDLRTNPGGVVQSALECSSYFLQPGQRIVTVKGRGLETQNVDVPKDAHPYAFPVAILVTGKTASAAEIFTGALQDHDRATVIGEQTYGKGLVQNVFPLTGNTGLALTTAFYYTPSGRSIQHPLDSGQLNFSKPRGKFQTDAGRTVLGGGGIQPDMEVAGDLPTRLKVALDASGSFTAFATYYVQSHKVDSSFRVDGTLLDAFQLYASEHQIQPPVGEWLKDRDWIQNRLLQEILNQAVGVAQGDEVEAQRDPAIRAGLRKVQGGPS